MKNCCRAFFDNNSLQNVLNEPLQYCGYCGRKLNDDEFVYYNKNLIRGEQEKNRYKKALIEITCRETLDEIYEIAQQAIKEKKNE